jgi:hypothetical protein
MSISLLFWMIVIIGILFGLYNNRATPFAWVGNYLILWVLVILLGWAVFGAAVHR